MGITHYSFPHTPTHGRMTCMTAPNYNAVIRRDGQWWIGWVEEVPGVNSQGATRDELLANLREALSEALDMNRDEARRAAGQDYEEVVIQP